MMTADMIIVDRITVDTTSIPHAVPKPLRLVDTARIGTGSTLIDILAQRTVVELVNRSFLYGAMRLDIGDGMAGEEPLEFKQD